MTSEEPPRRPPRDREGMRSAGIGVMIPVMLVACAVVGVLLGNLFDKWAGTKPWGVLVGLVLGMSAGVREVARLIKKMDR